MIFNQAQFCEIVCPDPINGTNPYTFTNILFSSSYFLRFLKSGKTGGTLLYQQWI
jgi:hypothetical protein